LSYGSLDGLRRGGLGPLHRWRCSLRPHGTMKERYRTETECYTDYYGGNG
jgi:hypothetical protein